MPNLNPIGTESFFITQLIKAGSTLKDCYVMCRNQDSEATIQYAIKLTSTGSIILFLEGTPYTIGYHQPNDYLAIFISRSNGILNATVNGGESYSAPNTQSLTTRPNLRLGCMSTNVGGTTHTGFFNGTYIESSYGMAHDYAKVKDTFNKYVATYFGSPEADRAYGVMWDETNDLWYRLGANNSTVDFNTKLPWSAVRRCNVLDNGTVSAYYGDPSYIENGSNGQVMVEYPKAYTKYEYTTVGNITYHKWYMSPSQLDGFTVDSSFIVDGVEKPYHYIGAYEGSIFDKSALAYLLADGQVADFTPTTGDLLCSIANAKPCSGLTQDLTIVKARILANNRGTGWGQWNALQVAFVQKLFMIEYNSANSQTKIGLGVVNKTDDGLTNMSNNTGATSFLGNLSGRQAGTDGLTSVSYRGLENMWGNIWAFVDGMNIQAGNKLWLNMSNVNMVSDSFVSPYVLQGTLANTNGYVSKVLGNPNGLFATQASGSSTTRIPDYYYQDGTGNRIGVLVGGWNGGSGAGFANWSFSNDLGFRGRRVGSRLTLIK